jgi:PAT family beta-lactamase induction signal transducer AmpG
MNLPLMPVWKTAITGASFGLYTGFVLVTLPQALAARHIPETTITSVTAIASAPGFFIFLLSPMLDVRLNRRVYAFFFTLVASAMMWASIVNIGRVIPLEIAATTGFAAITLANNGALYGWLSAVSLKEDEKSLSAWLTAANIGGVGIMAVLGGEILRRLDIRQAALTLSAMTLAPVLLYHEIPAPGPDRRLASESFRQFWSEVFALLKRHDVLVALALFLVPCGTFSLTNVLAGIGADFHASPRFVNLIAGIGVFVAGVFGSLMLPPLAKRVPLRTLYLTVGAVGSLLTLTLIPLPRTPTIFAVAVLIEQVCQSIAIACSVAICFEVIGQNNPLAATNFSLLISAYGFPISYMLAVDGWGYGLGKVDGAFLADAVCGIAACGLMSIMLFLVNRRRPTANVSRAKTQAV